MFAFYSSLKESLIGILGIFFLTACIVATIALLRTPVFEAVAHINIPVSSPSSSIATTDHSITLQTAVEILQGNALAEQVITTIGVTEVFSDLAQSSKGEATLLSRALSIFQQQLAITPMKESRIIKVTFQHTDPEMTAQVVETLLHLFEKEYKKLQSSATALHNEQLLLLRQEMYRAARALFMYQQAGNPLFFKEEQNSTAEEYDKVKILLSEAQKKLNEKRRQLKVLEEQFANRITLDIDNPNSGQEEQEKLTKFLGYGKALIHLKIYEQELIKKYGQGSSGDRLINNVRLQIASLQNTLYAETAIPETEYEQLEGMVDQIVLARKNYNEQQRKMDLLQRGISQLKNKLQRIEEQSAFLAQLQQKAETTREQYTTLATKLEIDPPVIPTEPIRPKKKSALILALISGLLGSLLYRIIQLLRNRNPMNS